MKKLATTALAEDQGWRRGQPQNLTTPNYNTATTKVQVCLCRRHAVPMGVDDAISVAAGQPGLSALAAQPVRHIPIIWAPPTGLLPPQSTSRLQPQRQGSNTVPESAVSSRLSHLRLASSAAAEDQHGLFPPQPCEAAAHATPPQQNGTEPALLQGAWGRLQQGSTAQQAQRANAGTACGVTAAGAGTALLRERSTSGTLKRVRSL